MYCNYYSGYMAIILYIIGGSLGDVFASEDIHDGNHNTDDLSTQEDLKPESTTMVQKIRSQYQKLYHNTSPVNASVSQSKNSTDLHESQNNSLDSSSEMNHDEEYVANENSESNSCDPQNPNDLIVPAGTDLNSMAINYINDSENEIEALASRAAELNQK
ncbi:hypothetical protein DASC09_052790 [Saccharomycopsis crataegensis]|uniref:Uncharacterized protein n=1 Tax=Saccharomycopsis crataegensis TaxID=43959 RepID=A0AAV5QT63_9ASCO|nr:hypothetical protein DASC09_052790 [Saccharomycopsis crataegensis]